jgi:Domain of unknown function (DUF4202)
VRSLSARYDAAVAAIDAANAADPSSVDVHGRTVPLALAHGRLAAEWVARLVEHPAETLLLAARAHHLRRWELRRDTYPDGRAGYLRWRKDQKERHAGDVAELLYAHGYATSETERVQQLIRRQPVDGSQTIEDAACLVFIETQLGSVSARMDHDRLVEVLRKTAAKMSDNALDLVAEIPLGDIERALLKTALGDQQRLPRAGKNDSSGPASLSH